MAGFAAVVERLRRSTVQVRGWEYGHGSGVIWRSSGLIITNAHVVRGSRARVELSEGYTLEAAVLARDSYRDLAALRIEADDLPAVAVGDSDALRVGELVLAVGNPLGLIGAVAVGIIHSVGSCSPGEQGSTRVPGNRRWIKADVRLAPGSSGGLLANAGGYVIGINSRIAGGLALAVPSNEVERFLHSQAQRPYLGVTTRPVLVPLGDERILGLLVLEIKTGSPAEKAGLLIGDVLIGINGQLFNSLDGPAGAIGGPKSDHILQLDLMRGGKRIVCNGVLVARTDGGGAA